MPDEPYQYAEWKRCRVNLDYHIEIAKHYYSVPHNLVRQEVETRVNPKTVESFLRGKRVASHLPSTLQHRPTTIAEHMPSSHRRYRDWTHERIRSEAAKVGPDVDTLIDVILRSRPHPEHGFRSAIGILGLVKRYSQERVDAACARLARLIAVLERVNLLILDDWGPEPLTADQRRDLLEIVDDRYDKGSLLITSQVPVSQWQGRADDFMMPPSSNAWCVVLDCAAD
ncbi:transposase [Bradyrhizobium sp. LB14.3]|uniref:Mu transposase domain-containing protein n=1 Tax=Bradyrhizobium sp. LB14.3 TaxID=3156328 RepID=UPI003391EF49